jgi:redox-sensitive bicupin YhaK (pirin superfamily)
MTQSTTTTQERTRRIAHRTFGERHGPIIRLVSPSGLGDRLKPFVFLDLFDAGASELSGFGWHPHSGIATLTYLWEGDVRYEDTTGAAGFLPAGGVEWFEAAGGAWHGGGAGNTGRSRGFQLWLALPPDQELGSAESVYQKPQDIRANGPASVLLGTLGGVSSPLKAPSSINYLAVRLKAGQTWRYEPPADHTICWVALASGSLLYPSACKLANSLHSSRRTRRSTSMPKPTPSSSSARPQAIRINSPSDTTRCTRVRLRFTPANSASPR